MTTLDVRCAFMHTILYEYKANCFVNDNSNQTSFNHYDIFSQYVTFILK